VPVAARRGRPPAHTLRLSAALVRAGKPHEVILLPGITHRPFQEAVAENLLLVQLDFLASALARPAQPASARNAEIGR
jgi:dipeptidyl-peptidase 4